MLRRNQSYLFLNMENLLLLARNSAHDQASSIRSTTTTKLRNEVSSIQTPRKNQQSHVSAAGERRSFGRMSSGICKSFNIQDYDIIGFDLDCTLLR